ncbi:MAG: HDOD domain-containing protein [Myxococcota bacterium]
MARVSETEIERAVSALRPFSGVARDLLRVTADPSHAVADVVAVIERDPGLTIRLLEIANSPVFAPASPIESVDRAVGFMGERGVVAAALERAADWLHAPLEGYGARSALFEEGLRTATASSQLARSTGFGDLASTAFTAGLLHDVGRIVGSTLLAPLGAEARAAWLAEPEIDGLAVETRLIGLDHCALGARVAIRFELPESLRAAIEFHHAPSGASAEHRPLVAIVHLADAIRAMIGGDDAVDALAHRFERGVVEWLGLEEESLERVMFESWLEAEKLMRAVGRGSGG